MRIGMGSLLRNEISMTRDEGGHGFSPARGTTGIFAKVSINAETIKVSESKPSRKNVFGEES